MKKALEKSKNLYRTCLVGLITLFVPTIPALSQTSQYRNVVGLVSDGAYQNLSESDVVDFADQIKTIYKKFDLSKSDALDIAIASMALAAHYDRISMQPPFLKFVESPKRNGRSYRADHIVGTVLKRSRIHIRETDGCVLRRLIEGDSAEQTQAQIKKFEEDPNYVCNEVITKPQADFSIEVGYSDWFTPLPDLKKPAFVWETRTVTDPVKGTREEKVQKPSPEFIAYRKEHTVDQYINTHSGLRELALKARNEGAIKIEFLNNQIPFVADKTRESEDQVLQRLGELYVTLNEKLAFIKLPIGTFHAMPLSKDLKDLADAEGNDVWGGPITLNYSNPAPRSVSEFLERTHMELSRYYMARTRSKFVRGLIFAKRSADHMTPGPGTLKKIVESESLVEREADIATLQIVAPGPHSRKDLYLLVQKTLKNLRDNIASGKINGPDSLNQWLNASKKTAPEYVKLNLNLIPRTAYQSSRYIRTHNAIDQFRHELVFDNEKESVAWLNSNDGQEFVFVIALNKGERRSRKIDWEKDHIDFDTAEMIAFNDAFQQELTRTLLGIFDSGKLGIMPQRDLEEVDESYRGFNGDSSRLAQRVSASLASLFKKGGAADYFGSVLIKAPNLPRNYACVDSQMALPTCKMTQDQWDSKGAHGGWSLFGM